MNRNLMTPTKLSAQASTVKSINSNDVEAFKDFWTNGRAGVQFVPVASFLEWRGIPVRDDKHPNVFAAKDWTFSYRTIAAAKYDEDEPMCIKKLTVGILLFEADFLCEYFDLAKEVTVNRALGLDTKLN